MQVTLKPEALASMFHISSKSVSSHISRLKTSLVEQALESGSFEQLQGKLSIKNVIGSMYDILVRLWNPVAVDCPAPDAEFLATQNTSSTLKAAGLPPLAQTMPRQHPHQSVSSSQYQT